MAQLIVLRTAHSHAMRAAELLPEGKGRTILVYLHPVYVDEAQSERGRCVVGGRLAPATRIIDLRHIVSFVCRMVDAIFPGVVSWGGRFAPLRRSRIDVTTVPYRKAPQVLLRSLVYSLLCSRSCTTSREVALKGMHGIPAQCTGSPSLTEV